MGAKEISNDLKGKIAAVNQIWDSIGEGEPTETQKSDIITLNKEIEQLENRLTDTKQWQDMRANHDRIAQELSTPAGAVPMPGAGSKGNGAADFKSIGELFANHAQFKEWLNRIAPSGNIPEGYRVGESPAIPVPGFGAKSLVTTSRTSAGALIQTDIKPLVDLVGSKPLNIRDLITIGRTTSDLIEYPQLKTKVNNAAPVAEATATAGASGAKPESGFTMDKATATVKVIAHWIPVTKKTLRDVAQIETMINNFLEEGLQEQLEFQILKGDGTGENFKGLIGYPGLTAQAYATDPLTTTRKARTKARVTGRANSTAFLMHPDDWEALDLTKDAESRYYFGGPSVLGTPRLWGLPVVENETVTAGLAYTGDLKQIVVWDREQTTIRMTDSHSDFFTRNMVAILAELAAAMGILAPAKIVEIDLTAA